MPDVGVPHPGGVGQSSRTTRRLGPARWVKGEDPMPHHSHGGAGGWGRLGRRLGRTYSGCRGFVKTDRPEPAFREGEVLQVVPAREIPAPAAKASSHSQTNRQAASRLPTAVLCWSSPSTSRLL